MIRKGEADRAAEREDDGRASVVPRRVRVEEELLPWQKHVPKAATKTHATATTDAVRGPEASQPASQLGVGVILRKLTDRRDAGTEMS